MRVPDLRFRNNGAGALGTLIDNHAVGVVLKPCYVRVWPPPLLQGLIDNIDAAIELVGVAKLLKEYKE